MLRTTSALRVAHVCTRRCRLGSAGTSRLSSTNAATRKRTKKSYDTLPASYIREDGTVAPALEPLVDTANVPKPRRKRVSKTSTAAPSANDTSSSVTSASPTSTSVTEGDQDGQELPLPAKPASLLATQIYENRAKFPGSILLTRVGQFYESYFEQAPEVASLLDIKLTSRPWGGNGRRAHMCGFPLSHLDRHLKTLVQTHHRFVALCEEFPPTVPGEEFVRRVVRVVTPGTLIDESFVNTYENNYLLAITVSASAEDGALENAAAPEVGLAWIDVSTGEFYSQKTTLENLRDDVSRIGPREVILEKTSNGAANSSIIEALSDEATVMTTLVDAPYTSTSPALFEANLEEQDPQDLSAPPIYTPSEQESIALLSSVLRSRLLEHMPSLSYPLRQDTSARMQLDSHTIHALEIKETMREGGTKGSLLSTVKRTLTSGGTRLLSRWLCSPSTFLPEINARQSVVAALHSHPHLLADVRVLLKDTSSIDVTRIVQRFMTSKGSAEDLLAIRDAIRLWRKVETAIEQEGSHSCRAQPERSEGREDWEVMDKLRRRMRRLEALEERIDRAIDEDALRTIASSATTNAPGLPTTEDGMGPASTALEDDGGQKDKRQPVFVIRPEFSTQLSRLHTQLQEAFRERAALEAQLQDKFAAPSLTLRHSSQHGFYVHIGKIRRDDALISTSSEVISLARSKSTHVYLHKAWLSLGKRTMELENTILREERGAFDTLRAEILSHAVQLRANARIVDELDVAQGFASLAMEMKFVRPLLDESLDYEIVEGRHPTVEMGLLASGRNFVPNSVSLSPASRLHLITGPNMSGKSSLLRQTALIAILAQTGSFVPASSARLGVIDKVFSRVGAKDDLYRDRSTFMVEMLETAEILRRATSRSLVIMDEVGRGTTVKDGMALAFATVHHLVKTSGSRALFATHFHELADMLGYDEDNGGTSGSYPGVGFFCTDVVELENHGFAYSHRIRPGVNRNSHGLKVAHLAGMPPAVMGVASRALEWMHDRGGSFIADRDALKQLGRRLGDSEQ